MKNTTENTKREDSAKTKTILGRFFRMEEISCEVEQEDSAKNSTEKESTKGSLERTKSLRNNMTSRGEQRKLILEVESHNARNGNIFSCSILFAVP